MHKNARPHTKGSYQCDRCVRHSMPHQQHYSPILYKHVFFVSPFQPQITMYTSTSVSSGEPASTASLPRYLPRLGVSAVIDRAVHSNPSTGTPGSPVDAEEVDPVTPVTCRFRPGLRPVRIVESFRFKRRQESFRRKTSTITTESEYKSLRPTSLRPQGKRQPLKAFQQNTLPTNFRWAELL